MTSFHASFVVLLRSGNCNISCLELCCATVRLFNWDNKVILSYLMLPYTPHWNMRLNSVMTLCYYWWSNPVSAGVCLQNSCPDMTFAVDWALKTKLSIFKIVFPPGRVWMWFSWVQHAIAVGLFSPFSPTWRHWVRENPHKLGAQSSSRFRILLFEENCAPRSEH